MIWKIKITEMTGIKYPLIMGAFAGVGRTEFASAFSDAGGLGIIKSLKTTALKLLKNHLYMYFKMRVC